MMSEQHVVLPYSIQRAEIVKVCTIPVCKQQQLLMMATSYVSSGSSIIDDPGQGLLSQFTRLGAKASRHPTSTGVPLHRQQIASVQYNRNSGLVRYVPVRVVAHRCRFVASRISKHSSKSFNKGVIAIVSGHLCCDHIFDMNHSADSRNGRASHTARHHASRRVIPYAARLDRLRGS